MIQNGSMKKFVKKYTVSEFIKNEILLNLEQVCESKRTSITKAVSSVMKDWQLDSLTAADLVFDWWDTLKHYQGE